MSNSKMMSPAGFEAGTKMLRGIHTLMTAKSWERAMIVATMVRLVQLPGETFHTPASFANLGIGGLTSTESVKKAVQAWLFHSGDVYPLFNEEYDYPVIPWPTPADLFQHFNPKKSSVKAYDYDSTMHLVTFSQEATPETHREALKRAIAAEERAIKQLELCRAVREAYEAHPEAVVTGLNESFAMTVADSDADALA